MRPFRAVTASGRAGSSNDPYFANVSALLHMDGTNGSTTFTDVTGKTWTAHGSAVIDTSTSQYGGASGHFAASGDYINTASHADFGFGTGDFTIEGWIYRGTHLTNDLCAVDTRTGANQGVGIYVGTTGNAGGLSYVNNSVAVGTGGTFTDGVWAHWAAVRQGTTIYGYINGVQVFTGTDSRTLASASTCFIGDNYIAPSQPVQGWVDDIRVTKGVCRYPSGTTFTPPAVFPNS